MDERKIRQIKEEEIAVIKDSIQKLGMRKDRQGRMIDTSMT